MNSHSNSSTTCTPDITTTGPAEAPTTILPKVELLTQVQMSQHLGISRRTLHNWVLDGMVPMIKVRGFCRFEPAKVWAALLQREVSAALPSASALRRGIVPLPEADAAPAPSTPSGIKVIPLPHTTPTA